ncbi:hypothetical protein HDV05_003947, partial [Chytridiales sp. JEL 0842]
MAEASPSTPPPTTAATPAHQEPTADPQLRYWDELLWQADSSFDVNSPALDRERDRTLPNKKKRCPACWGADHSRPNNKACVFTRLLDDVNFLPPELYWRRIEPLVEAGGLEDPNARTRARQEFWRSPFGAHLSKARELAEPVLVLPKEVQRKTYDKDSTVAVDTTDPGPSLSKKTRTIKHGIQSLIQQSLLTPEQRAQMQELLDTLVEGGAVMRYMCSRLANAVLVRRVSQVFPALVPEDPYACCQPPIMPIGTFSVDKFQCMINTVSGRTRQAADPQLEIFVNEAEEVWRVIKGSFWTVSIRPAFLEFLRPRELPDLREWQAESEEDHEVLPLLLPDQIPLLATHSTFLGFRNQFKQLLATDLNTNHHNNNWLNMGKRLFKVVEHIMLESPKVRELASSIADLFLYDEEAADRQARQLGRDPPPIPPWQRPNPVLLAAIAELRMHSAMDGLDANQRNTIMN